MDVVRPTGISVEICDSPQYLINGQFEACGLCLACCKAKDDASRQRRLYWLKKKRGYAHA